MLLRLSRLLSVAALVGGLLGAADECSAQLQQGSVHGIVLSPDGQPADVATVTLLDSLGAPLVTVTALRGAFTLASVAPGTYSIRAEAPPLRAIVQQVTVSSAVP